jgi:hypothetical protein
MQHLYRPNQKKLIQLTASGFVASFTIVLLGVGLREANVPAPDFAALMGAIVNSHSLPEIYSAAWWGGFAVYLLAFVLLLPVTYDYLVDRTVLPSTRWLKGFIFGSLIWLCIEMLVKPLAGEGFFSRITLEPLAISALCLLNSWIYGILLDGLTRLRIVHDLRIGAA